MFTEKKTLCVTSIHSTYTQGLLEQIEYKLKSRNSNGFFFLMFFPSSPLSALHPLKTVHVWRAASGPEMTSGSICSPSSLCSQPDKSAVLFFFLFVSRDSSVGPYCICITHKSDSYVTSHPLAVTLTSAELAAECWCDKSNRQT